MKKYIVTAVLVQLLVTAVIFFTAKLASVDAGLNTENAELIHTITVTKNHTDKKIKKENKNSAKINKIEPTLTVNQSESINQAAENIISDNKAYKDASQVTNEPKTASQSESSSQSNQPKSTSNSSKRKVVTITNNDHSTQEIQLLDVEVSDDIKQKALKKAEEIEQQQSHSVDNRSQDSVLTMNDQNLEGTMLIAHDLGMANVPVLSQGSHGTCVTFATTAILDAKMNAGDFISQQCMLELGVYINAVNKCANNSCSGWNGSFNKIILDRMKTYGVISKDSCPHQYANTSYSLNYQMYLNLSGKLWTDSFNFRELKARDLNVIKQAINNNNRVAIGILLHKDFLAGTAINGKSNGLWSIPYNATTFTNEMYFGGKLAGGHALVVVGYDDNKKLLKVRNSWGRNVGDSGEFYISYDYYELFSNGAGVEVY